MYFRFNIFTINSLSKINAVFFCFSVPHNHIVFNTQTNLVNSKSPGLEISFRMIVRIIGR